MQDAIERRFDRIETALETMAKGMAKSESDFRALFEATVQIVAVQAKQAESIESMLAIMASLAEAQFKLTNAQAKSEAAQAETQGKLDALIHIWDDWIRERGGKNGSPPPA